MSTKFKRILFDYDGTILMHNNEEEGIRVAEALGLDEEQIKIFADQLMDFFANQKFYYKGKKVTYSLYYSAMLHYIPCINSFGLEPKHVDDIINKYNMIYSELAVGVKETLDYLKEQGYIICLMTNGFLKEQSESMKHNNIYEYFDRIYTWDNEYAKPDHRFIKRVLAGTDPKDNVVVGNDLISDISMAKNAGVYTIGFNLATVNTLDGIKPDIEIPTFSTLMEIL